MSALNVQEITVQYQQHTAVDNVSFTLQQGEVGCLLGPSGCGKTSILRAIAGFEPIATGRIQLNRQLLASKDDSLPPQQRNVGMVFQDFALYPHLTVWDNVAFGIKHLDTQQQKDRIHSLLSLVALTPYKDRYPHELSGGQQQRVALIRALAPSPDLLLMDEPFSSLDVALRQSLAEELRHILKQANIMTILVTHDQNEAFAMADAIGVMHEGKLAQWGEADALYQSPSSRFVADFIGQGAFIPASLVDNQTVMTAIGKVAVGKHVNDGSDSLVAHLRPEMLAIDPSSATKATITRRLYLGGQVLYDLQLAEGVSVKCLTPNHQIFDVKAEVGVKLNTTTLNCFGTA